MGVVGVDWWWQRLHVRVRWLAVSGEFVWPEEQQRGYNVTIRVKLTNALFFRQMSFVFVFALFCFAVFFFFSHSAFFWLASFTLASVLWTIVPAAQVSIYPRYCLQTAPRENTHGSVQNP